MINLVKLIFIISIVSIFIIILFSFVLGELIINPVKKVTSFFNKMAQGEGDLTKKIVNKSRDEVGELSINFNKFISNLASMIKYIRNSTDNLNKIGIDLSVTNKENIGKVTEQLNKFKTE